MVRAGGPLGRLGPGGALKASEMARAAGETLAKELDLSARAANAEVLRATAAWLMRHRTDQPDLARRAVEAHRLMLGEANPNVTFDSLFARVLA